MILHKNNFVSVGDIVVDNNKRHLITIIEPGKMSFWLKDLSGNTLNYFYYDYIGMNGGTAGDVFGEEAFLLQGNGNSVYLLNHKMTDETKIIRTTPYDTPNDLPLTVPANATWAVGDYALVKKDHIYGKVATYSISLISESTTAYWVYTGALRGKKLGTLASANNLPLTVGDTVNVGDYYEISGEAKTSYICESISALKVPTWLEYSFPGIVDVHIQRASDCAKVTCGLAQWRNYIEMDFGAAVKSTEKYILKINNHFKANDNIPIVPNKAISTTVVSNDGGLGNLMCAEAKREEQQKTVWRLYDFVQINIHNRFNGQPVALNNGNKLYEVPASLIFKTDDQTGFSSMIVGYATLSSNDLTMGRLVWVSDNSHSHVSSDFVRCTEITLEFSDGKYYLCYNTGEVNPSINAEDVFFYVSWVMI